LILIKSFVYKNEKKEIKEDKKPSIEYYEWKRLYFKIIVLHEIKEIYNKKIHYHHKLKYSNSIKNKSAHF
jgi:adenylate kinase family enzyme